VKLGFVGFGRMGGNMVKRLLDRGHEVSVYARRAEVRAEAATLGASPAPSIADLVGHLASPRVVWLMIPAGQAVDATLAELTPLLSRGDIIVDGGNSWYRDSVRRAQAAAAHGLQYVDAGTSGGIWGLKVGYCLMVGGAPEAVRVVEPAFKDLAPEGGYLHVGPSGAGHFVKMIHNGIEYGMMQAYAEGFSILHDGPYKIDLRAVSALWNHGSVVRSWLLELAELAFADDPDLRTLRGYVEDSGEGRWTVQEAIDRNVPAPIITLSLVQRLRSRQEENFGDKVLAALRQQFGGHAVRRE
jgi:6-phosphogluconate dehydrogenase